MRPLFLYYALLINLVQLDPINYTLLGLSVIVIEWQYIKLTNVSVSYAFASKVSCPLKKCYLEYQLRTFMLPPNLTCYCRVWVNPGDISYFDSLVWIVKMCKWIENLYYTFLLLMIWLRYCMYRVTDNTCWILTQFQQFHSHTLWRYPVTIHKELICMHKQCSSPETQDCIYFLHLESNCTQGYAMEQSVSWMEAGFEAAILIHILHYRREWSLRDLWPLSTISIQLHENTPQERQLCCGSKTVMNVLEQSKECNEDIWGCFKYKQPILVK